MTRNFRQKNFNSISTEFIDNKVLLKLQMHILTTGYLEEKAFYFTKITKDKEKINEDGKKAEMVSNSKKESKKKALYKEK